MHLARLAQDKGVDLENLPPRTRRSIEADYAVRLAKLSPGMLIDGDGIDRLSPFLLDGQGLNAMLQLPAMRRIITASRDLLSAPPQNQNARHEFMMRLIEAMEGEGLEPLDILARQIETRAKIPRPTGVGVLGIEIYGKLKAEN